MEQGLDFERLAGVVAAGPAPLFATVSGSHLYGFSSPDSDVDLRGAFVQPLPERLRLRPPADTVTVHRVEQGIDLDWVAHDVHKFALLMTKRNGYVLEQLYSPLVVTGGDWLDELREIGRGCTVRYLYYHYRGFARTRRGDLDKPRATVKDLLYLYRVLLTGVHVLRTGEVQAHLPTLLQDRPLTGVAELMDRKRAGAEHGVLGEGEWDAHRPAADRLDQTLAAAFEGSGLPDRPTTKPALSDYVVRACLELGG